MVLWVADRKGANCEINRCMLGTTTVWLTNGGPGIVFWHLKLTDKRHMRWSLTSLLGFKKYIYIVKQGLNSKFSIQNCSHTHWNMITFIGDQIYMSEYVTCPDVSTLRYISAKTIINLLKPICEFSSSSVMYAPVGMMGRNVFFNALRSNWCIDWSFGQLKTLPHSVINKPTRQMSGYSSKTRH